MPSTADLHIQLTSLDFDTYHLTLQLHLPVAEMPPQRSRVRFDFERLQALFPDPESYGNAVSQALFGDPDVRDYLAEARRLAAQAGLPLRLLLEIDPARTKLLGLRWETLRDPQDGSWLLGHESLQLQRRLSSPDWPPDKPIPAPTGRALAAIACPQDLHGQVPWTMGQAVSAVNARLETALAGLSLAGYETTMLVGPPAGDHPVTVANLQAALCDEVDVLYIVCPAALRLRGDDSGLYLFLEDPTGRPQPLSASEMLSVLSGCKIPPLVVLAAPQAPEPDGSWRQSDPLGALRRLVPGLLELGAAGVLAFNGAAGQEMLSEFLPRLLHGLRQSGEAGPALAAARAAVRYQPDAWTPALFLRRAVGRLWHSPQGEPAAVTPAPRQANTWLVSASPERLNWMQAFAAGTIIWDRSFGERARAVLEQVRPGDTLLLYSADPENSLLGLGEALDAAHPVSDWEGERLAIRLMLRTHLRTPIPRQELAAAVPSLEILRAPYASFTRVTVEEWAAIREVITKNNPGFE